MCTSRLSDGRTHYRAIPYFGGILRYIVHGRIIHIVRYTCTTHVNISLTFLFVVKNFPFSGVVEITGPLQFSLQTTPTADPPVFTLTCVSTGGPATTVTWTRNGAILSNDANHVFTKTVTDQLTATYSNVLTVTGREPGSYQCSVANARTAQPATASLIVAGE